MFIKNGYNNCVKNRKYWYSDSYMYLLKLFI